MPTGSMTTPHPFRFGVQAMVARSAAEWQRTARQAEDLGFSTLSLGDHYVGPGPVYDRSNHAPQNLAPIAAMAAAATVTSEIRIACRVFCVDFHVPAVLAGETATLDLLSDGRLEVGLGAGYVPDEYDAMGVAFEPGARRVAKLEEVVALLKAHWSGEQIAVTGEHVRVSGYSGLQQTAQRPRPTVLIGGNRPTILALAGREADIVSINTVPFTADETGRTPEEQVLRRVDIVREAAGERFGELEFEMSPYWTEITDDTDAAVDRVVSMMKVPPEAVLSHPNVVIGSVDEVVERLHRRRETTGVSYITVPQSSLETFAPVVARLTGE